MSEKKQPFYNPGAIVGGIVGLFIASKMMNSGDMSMTGRGFRFGYIIGVGIGFYVGKLLWEVVTAGPRVALADREVEVDGKKLQLRSPALSALFAFLLPGAGHLYQGRTRKGWMFMICILTTYFFGFAIGGGHVVYASWVKGDIRWHYICQAPVGVVTLPALIEGNHMRKHTENGRTTADYAPLFGGLMAPPRRPPQENVAEDLASWYAARGAGYEMGTWYTMIAGLLNVLVIFDAYAGPLAIPISGKANRPPPDDEEDAEKEPSKKEKI